MIEQLDHQYLRIVRMGGVRIPCPNAAIVGTQENVSSFNREFIGTQLFWNGILSNDITFYSVDERLDSVCGMLVKKIWDEFTKRVARHVVILTRAGGKGTESDSMSCWSFALR